MKFSTIYMNQEIIEINEKNIEINESTYIFVHHVKTNHITNNGDTY